MGAVKLSRRNYGQACSIARSLEIVGERWTFLIVRNALIGECRFDSFLNSLGLPRNVLTDRLNTLVDRGILERVPYQQRPLRNEYRLTPKGRELMPILLALMQWGDRYTTDESGPPRVAYHEECGGRTEVKVVCTECGHAVEPYEVTTRAAVPV
jgi:DNA-binding HxlR family transcriptional regulator